MRYTWMESPVGDLLLAGTSESLHRLHFSKGSKATQEDPSWQRDDRAFHHVVLQLREYFSGRRRHFDVRLHPHGTPFQLQVWEQLQTIPYGQTISYGELAGRIGNPAASRAVGLANGANPIAILIPCHRVIGANGKLTGFGGGIDVKEKLLALERGEQTLELESYLKERE
ncbi:MAG: methylated-DNA--[protein]-cysteine S-methyltransferase [Bryobacterales bacterium]|nr:methylated-DNA--[protein]-cysteine S-methyltransferase [Bryobacterales bacterium]